MTPKELFEINGEFAGSPLVRTARHLDALFQAAGVPYAVIGGMAVARNGALRTTHDVDVLTEREGWERIRARPGAGFAMTPDSARDLETNVHVQVLFGGDDWDMAFPLPHPAAVSEYDASLGARFMDLHHLLELKCAVYLSKRGEYGVEVAAKDLADVVDLVRHNRDRLPRQVVDTMHPAVRRLMRRVIRKVLRASLHPRSPRQPRGSGHSTPPRA